jgi:hypothetical protein
MVVDVGVDDGISAFSGTEWGPSPPILFGLKYSKGGGYGWTCGSHTPF